MLTKVVLLTLWLNYFLLVNFIILHSDYFVSSALTSGCIRREYVMLDNSHAVHECNCLIRSCEHKAVESSLAPLTTNQEAVYLNQEAAMILKDKEKSVNQDEHFDCEIMKLIETHETTLISDEIEPNSLTKSDVSSTVAKLEPVSAANSSVSLVSAEKHRLILRALKVLIHATMIYSVLSFHILSVAVF